LVITTLISCIQLGWGYVEPYIASYLHSFSEGITTGKVHMLFSVMEIGQIIGAQMFHLVTSRLGYRETLTLALALNATAWLICSISTTIYGFIIPALLWGMAMALRYMMCSFFMVELMPENYALAAGLGNIGEPVSILFWSWAPLLLANPNNDSPDITITKNSMTEYYFGEAVTSKVPFLFRVVMVMAIVAGS
jgi:MFS family permease